MFCGCTLTQHATCRSSSTKIMQTVWSSWGWSSKNVVRAKARTIFIVFHSYFPSDAIKCAGQHDLYWFSTTPRVRLLFCVSLYVVAPCYSVHDTGAMLPQTVSWVLCNNAAHESTTAVWVTIKVHGSCFPMSVSSTRASLCLCLTSLPDRPPAT